MASITRSPSAAMPRQLSGLVRRRVLDILAISPGYWLMVLILILLPLEIWSLPYTLRVSDLGLLLATLYQVLYAVITRQRLHFPLLMPVWLILFSSLLAMMLENVPSASVLAVVQEVYIFATFTALVNLIASLTQEQQDRLIAVWCLVSMAIGLTTVMGALHVGPAAFYESAKGEFRLEAANLNRGLGTFSNPNAAAIYLVISLFLVQATDWPAWQRALGIAWLFVSVYATGSMAGIVSVAAGLIAMTTLKRMFGNRKVTSLYMAMLGFAGAMMAALAGAVNLPDILTGGAGTSNASGLLELTLGRLPRSAGGRFELIRHAWPNFRLHPWGTGPGTGAPGMGTLHNDYFAFLVERGPLGLLGWLWLIGDAALTPLLAASRQVDPAKRRHKLALATAFIACAVSAFTHEVSHFRQVWLLMAFIYGTSFTEESRSLTADGARTDVA